MSTTIEQTQHQQHAGDGQAGTAKTHGQEVAEKMVCPSPGLIDLGYSGSGATIVTVVGTEEPAATNLRSAIAAAIDAEIKAEREACATIIENMRFQIEYVWVNLQMAVDVEETMNNAAAAIRDRK